MWVIVYAYRQDYACKSNWRCVQTQKSTWCTDVICVYFSWCIKRIQLVNSCKSYGNQTGGFYAANASTDKSKKLKINFVLTWCRCFNSLNNTKAVLLLNQCPGLHIQHQELSPWTLLSGRVLGPQLYNQPSATTRHDIGAKSDIFPLDFLWSTLFPIKFRGTNEVTVKYLATIT